MHKPTKTAQVCLQLIDAYDEQQIANLIAAFPEQVCVVVDYRLLFPFVIAAQQLCFTLSLQRKLLSFRNQV